MRKGVEEVRFQVQSESEIMDIIKVFLEQDLSTRASVETIVLSGSYATGKDSDHSDIDLCYIGEFVNFGRQSLFYNGREFQHKWWAVKTKYILEELRTRDTTMANLVERCLNLPGLGPELEIVCTYVLEPLGGWMKESWKS
ncbi:nucleotidyltransferase domain-containing protein [Paenibacillus radicis (ex Xue et al. 2023)]|uniref:Nucleotidyltransferase domain-containing protein n=1 Tax=Paenibacillus radicis (ex Xue et al. 2023) TaxID=2972489 RepID=A0ABT1YDS2_9BACL|nr:nucleotidyltransferase domain-containing protein [Paenibacillus radicis (ex Xue et al. 2023)]MCR8630120.1 nucleotidyltransferase domain-containing protein [Paenibacillus radicis (ex Xue et al. 2023)]